MTTTTNKLYTLPVIGGNTDTWGTLLNANFTLIDANFGGTAAINCAGNVDVTLNATQASNYYLSLTGLLTGSISVKVPQAGGFWRVKNGTTGAFTITIKTTNGSSVGVIVPQGSVWEVASDGTNVSAADWSDGTQFYGTDGGTASALAATVRVAVTAYFEGLAVTVKCANANDAAATLSINGIGGKPIYEASGGIMVPVGEDAWAVGQDVSFRYDTSLNTGSGGWQAATSVLPALGALAFLNTVAAAQIDSDAVITAKILDLNVTTGKIANNAVTFAKMQAITDGRLLGASGSTAVAEMTVGSGLTLAGSALGVTGYATGTFVPQLNFGGAHVGMTTSVAAGTDTRLANIVKFTVSITLTATGSSTGNATITGLPFTSATLSSPVSVYWSGMTGLTGSLVAILTGLSSTITLHQSSATGATPINQAVFTNTSVIIISGTYEV